MDNPFNLRRFVDAQEPVIASVLVELEQGRKRGHWIWFIFPQLKGLGRSPQSEFFGISSLDEALAYLQHPVLGQRLERCAQLVNAVEGRSAEDIFGEVDAMAKAPGIAGQDGADQAGAGHANGGLGANELLEKGRLLDRIGRYDEAFC